MTAEPPFPGLLPDDPDDDRLREEVHPSGWINPDPLRRYHLVVLGAGTGGLVTAAIAAALGARVALVERALMGGDCLNTGCVPSKALLRSARGWQAARDAAARFGGPPAPGAGDFSAVMARMRRLRADLAPVDGARRFRDDLGVDVYLGEGRFAGRDAVEVDGRLLRFRRCVVATGGRAAVPPVAGLAGSGYLTHETVFSLTRCPARLVVIGGGSVGCELAQAFARLGSRVTVLEGAPRILPGEDADAAEVVASALRRDGVELLPDVRVEEVRREGKARVVRYRAPTGSAELRADQLLVAAGRVPDVEALDLPAAGIRAGEHGVEVDDRLRTTNPRVYAIGDVIPGPHFTHAADAQARLVVRNALFFGRGRASRLVIPRCTYTEPELAHVGISPEAARAAGAAVRTLTIPLGEVDRARLEGTEDGFLRVHLRAGSDRILSATLVAAHAGEVISQLTQAMVAGVGLQRLGQVVYPYPTEAEVIRKAADALRRERLTPSVKAAFGWFFRTLS